jgi:hypothetical protein
MKPKTKQKKVQVGFQTDASLYETFTQSKLITMRHFMERCMRLYINDPTFKAIVHGCVVNHPENLTD